MDRTFLLKAVMYVMYICILTYGGVDMEEGADPEFPWASRDMGY